VPSRPGRSRRRRAVTPLRSCTSGVGSVNYCGGSLRDRFLLHIDYGVVNPLNFQDNLGPVSTPSGTVFQFLYYFLINLVLTAIVSGIIIG
jgi:hypothetical protein